MRQSGLAEAAAVAAAALVLTAALTFPLVLGLDRLGRLNTADGMYAIWNVAWVADALIVHPSELYNANIFYPNRQTLAYSEANIGAGVVALPVWGFTGNPLLAYNSVLFFGFVMSAAGAYALVKTLTGRRDAAAVCGVLYAFCPFVFARTAHIQLLLVYGLPWVLRAFHRLVDRPTPWRATALGVWLWIQALSCAYYGIFGGLAVGLATLWFAWSRGSWRSPRYWGAIALAAAVSIGLTLPFFLPYLDVQAAGFGREMDEARDYSTNWAAWLQSAAWAHRLWQPLAVTASETAFPGILATVLGLAGLWRGLRRPTTADASAGAHDGLPRDVVGFYGVLALVTCWTAFGPAAGLYAVLYKTIPVFSFLRAPARIGILVTLALVVLTGGWLAAWLRQRARPVLWATVLVVVAAAELATVPLRQFREAPPLPEAYRALGRLPRGAVAEFPYFYERRDFPRHAEYMFASTYHFMPLVNGYSDYIPGKWRANVRPLSSFPTRESFGILGRLNTRYVVFHLASYDRRSRARLLERLKTYGDFLRPLVQQDDVWLYEIVAWPN
jgi:hypothetical protein